MKHPRLGPFALICMLSQTSAWGDVALETEREIQFLLQYVASSGCGFERNGTAHDAADAADHLRLKYRRGGRYVSTTEHFIDRLASESSWSGKAYTVTCDGLVIPSGEWLHDALIEYRAGQAALTLGQ